MNTSKNTTILSSLVTEEKRYTDTFYSQLDTTISNYLADITNIDKKNSATNFIKTFYTNIGVDDPILTISGKYLNYADTGFKTPTNIYNFFTISLIDNQIQFVINPSLFTFFINKYLPLTSLFFDKKGKIFDIFYEALNNYINLNGENNNYLFYEIPRYHNRTIEQQQDGYSFETKYNYYLKEFEETFVKNKNYASSMPNFYFVERDLLNPNISQITKQTIADRSYFVSQAKNVDNQIISGSISPIQNISINTKSISNFLSPTAFPYYNTITFTNKVQNKSLNKFLEDNKLTTLCLNNFHRIAIKPQNTSSVQNLLIQKSFTEEKIVDTSIYKNIYGQPVSYRTYIVNDRKSVSPININDVLYFNNTSPIGFGVETTGSLVVEPIQEINDIISSGVSKVFDYVKAINTVTKLFEKEINYNTVFNFQPLSTNTLFYIIEKYENDVLKQRISIPKLVDVVNNQYIDTQINYNIDVKYIIYSVELTPRLTTNYSSSYEDSKVNVIAQTTSSYEIYINELFTKNVKVNDTPPLIPSISFTTYKDISNKVLVNFNTTFGSIIETPITIISNDEEKFINLYSLQNRTDGKLEFSTTDPLKSIQMFILNQKPFSYSDYQSVRPVEILMNSSFGKSIALQIQPNAKYYFMFRSVDIHDLISNPSLIYELEIIENSGAIYPILNVVNFDINKSYNTSKSFKKYINVQPSLEYTLLTKNEDETVTLGNNKALWDQKYKIRVTSKKSGKSFDVNLSFVKDEQDFT